MTAPTPDPTVALSLSKAGYWVVPLTGHKKHPPRFAGRTHAEIIADRDQSFMAALVIAQERTATGWALIPQPSDPVPLVIVDLDAYGLGLSEGWQMFAGNEPLPDHMGEVRSATGGWHFWLRLPDALAAKRIGSTWDFGNGRKGEIRASRDAIQLIVLPGSVVVNKQGGLGIYESVGYPLTDIQGLAPIPGPLLSRLQAHGKSAGGGADTDSLPTEAQHFLSLLRFISEIPPGEQNTSVAHVGQVLGRIGPADKPGPALTSFAWDALRDRLPPADRGAPWSFSDFERALSSGYKTGARSRNKHTSAPACPTLTDVKAECEAMLGGVPWLAEVVNSKGEFVQYLLGIGGSKADREKATAITVIKDRTLTHLLAELARICPTVDHDALVRSPLFVIPGWAKVLRYHLIEDRGEPERMGSDPEARFWETLNAWARACAEDGHFLSSINGAWKALPSKQWLIVFDREEWLLGLHPDAVERLYNMIGDMPVVKRLLATHMRPRALPGTSAKQQTIHLRHLAPETQTHVRAGFERWRAREDDQTKTDETDQPN